MVAFADTSTFKSPWLSPAQRHALAMAVIQRPAASAKPVVQTVA